MKTTQEKLLQRCVLRFITRGADPSNTVETNQKPFFKNFYCHVPSYSAVDLIFCLTCLIFLKSP